MRTTLLLNTWLSLASLCLINLPIKADNYYFNRISKKQGLPGTNIREIYQDHIGYMWFGIEAFGLCRYDGKNFMVFEYIPGDSCSITNNFIWDVESDIHNNLWVATENGLNYFDRKNQRFISFFQEEGNSISDNFIIKIFSDSKGNMWFGCSDGLNKLGVEEINRLNEFIESSKNCQQIGYKPNFKHFLYNDAFSEELGTIKIKNINEDSGGDLWVSTNKGVFLLNPSSNSIHHYSHNQNDPNSLIHNYTHFVREINKGKYLIGTDRGLCYLYASENRFEQISFEQIDYEELDLKGYYNYLVDSKDNEWIGFSEGLFIGKGLNNSKNTFDYQYITEGERGLGSKIIRAISEDKSGQIWIGTKFSGLHFYERNQQLFPYFQIGPVVNKPNYVEDNFVLSLLADDSDNIWVGTKYGGLFKYNRYSGQYESYWVDVDHENPVNSNRIECIYQDQKGAIWMGTPKGLNRLNQESGRFQSFSSFQISAMFEDSRGNFWIGTTNGIYVYNRSEEKITPFNDLGENKFFDDSTKFIYTIGEDKMRNIWFGTQENGLFIYDPFNKDVEHLVHDPTNPNSISGNMIRDIYRDSHDKLWISTKHNGVNYYDEEKGAFTYYTKKTGLSSNTVYSIAEDLDGNLWFGTHHGLSKFNRESKTFSNYNENHGLQSNIFENDARTITQDGFLLFGGQQGFNMFHPDSIEFKKFDPPLVINYVKANDKEVLREVNENTHFELPFNQNFVAFEFASLDYRNPSENKYRYKLNGVDKNWVEANNRNYILYPDLKHGEYTFMVQTIGTSISKKSDILKVGFTIHPPFWLTNGAYTIYVFIILAFLWGIYKVATLRSNYQHSLSKARNQLKQTMELNQTKLRFFTNISHEFQAPLALIMAPVEKLMKNNKLSENELKNVRLVQQNAKRLSQLIKQLMYFRKAENEVSHLEVYNINLVDFIKEIANPFYSLAQDYNINLQCIYLKDPVDLWFDPDKMEKIVTNLLMNAFKFTPSGGMIEISLTTAPNDDLDLRSKNRFGLKSHKGEYVKLSIRDTGRGMTHEQLKHIFERFYGGVDQMHVRNAGTGIGLELTKTLVEMHGGIITTESALGKGSVFTVWLRFGKEHFEHKNISNQHIEVKDYVSDVDFDLIIKDSSVNHDEPKIEEMVKSRKNGQQGLILIVDDNSDLRNFLRENLSDYYKVLTARDGEEGLELAKKDIPDLIISDVLMPKMDGIEMCEHIKTTVATSHIPVILLTRKTYIEDKIIGLQTGADDYIEKPFHTEYLLLRIRNIFASQQKIKEMLIKSIRNEDMQLSGSVSVYDQKLLDKCMKTISENIANPDYSIEELGKEVGLSRSQLYRKITALTDQTPNEFLYAYRLREAKKLMLGQGFTVTDAAHMTGFRSANSFSTVFKKHFGMSPKEFVSTHKV